MPISLTPKMSGKNQKKDPRDDHMLVSDYMTKKVITIQQDDDIFTAIEKLLKKHISGMPVVDKLGGLVGILSEKDCLKIMVHQTYHQHYGGKVEEYMSKTVISVTPDMSIVEVAGLFKGAAYRRLPVLDHGRLVGQLSRRDILMAIKKKHK